MISARRQWAIVGGIVLLLGAILTAATQLLSDELFPVTVGTKAPVFSGMTVDGTRRQKSLTDYKGKFVLLNIWATWCEPCVREMPSMERLHKEFGDKGLAIVAVSVDDPGTENKIALFAKQLGVTFEVLHDPAKNVARQYQATGYPESFIIGPEGTIRRKVFAEADWSSDANRALVRELLASTSTTAPH